jgi:hypothetical protein
MKKETALRIALVILFVGFVLSSCTAFTPSTLCGEETTPNHEAYAQYFTSVQLLNTAEEGSEQSPNAGRIFDSPNDLIIEAESITNLAVRFCIFEVKRGGEVLYNQTHPISGGNHSFKIGGFEPGSYMIRVYADEILVDNMQFLIR